MSPDWDKLEACRESLREHMALLNNAQRFVPPNEVIETWPEEKEWVIYDTTDKTWGYWYDVPDHIVPRGLDPRTLHHRSKFYPEGE